MSDYSGHAAITVLGVLGLIAGGVHFESATGAIIGSFFFLTLPSTVRGIRGFLLWIVSIFFGYSVGIWVSRSWDSNAGMFVALLLAALGAGILTALQKYVDGGPLPDFLERILNRIPFLKDKRGTPDA